VNDSAAPGWLLVGISFFADIAGLLSFFGFSAQETARAIVATALAAVAIVTGLVVFVRATRLWVSAKGPYIPAPFLRTKAIAALMFILLGAGLGVLVAVDVV
jgi:hypothetical protein